MFIQTESTPNPNSIKFLPGHQVAPDGPVDFVDIADAKAKSPLALKLLEIPDIESVFFGVDFITVTKSEEANWDLLKPEILHLIMEAFTVGRVLLSDSKKASATSEEDEDEVTAQIRELIETQVRPAVAQDGGDIIFESFDQGIVKLKLFGACSGCPSSTITLKNGIENMLKHYIPEVESVEAVE